jgi:hypothetical protein
MKARDKMISRFILAAVLCLCLAGCAASSEQAAQRAAGACAQLFKAGTAEYNACVTRKTREEAPLEEQMRRERSDEDADHKRAEDPQRDYMSR